MMRELAQRALIERLRRALPDVPLAEIAEALNAYGGVVPPQAKQDEQRFRLIFEESALGIALVGEDGCPQRCNRALERFLGYSQAELQTMSFTEFTYPEDRELDWSLYSELMSGKRPHYQIDKRYIHKAGNVVWARLTVSLVPGEPKHVIAMVEDQTVARAQQQEQARLVRVLAERVKELTALHQIAKLLHRAELSVTQVLASVSELLPAAFSHPSSARVRISYGPLQFAQPGFAATAGALSVNANTSGDKLTLEVAYEESDLEATFAPEEQLLAESVVELLAGALERRRAQERLEIAVTGTGAGVWEWQADTGRVICSEQMARMAGLEPGQFGETLEAFRALVHPEDLLKLRRDQEQLRATRDSLVTRELRLLLPAGETRWVSSTARVFRDESGKPLRMLGLAVDTTAKKQLEEQLLQSQKMDAVGGLAAGIAHDFNNMLSVVLSYSELALLDLGPGDPLFAELEEIKGAGIRARELTRHLLAFSRQQVLQPRVLSLNDTLFSMQPLLRSLVSDKIELSIVTAPDLAAVHADPLQLEQVILNLVVNAREAMPVGGRLSIQTANMSADSAYAAEHADALPGPYVTLAVTDSGVGMTPQVQARMFEPFFTTKEQGIGTGLGLPMVLGIVQQSGGHISVWSQPGKGTVLRVCLPRVEGAVENAVMASAAPPVLRGTETILLVEDEPKVRTLARTVLMRHGYRVLEAQDGQEACLLAERPEVQFDLLLTDVLMPVLDGLGLAERLRRSRPQLRVLYMSGFSRDASLGQRALEPGFGFIQKPLTPQVLLFKLRELLDAPS